MYRVIRMGSVYYGVVLATSGRTMAQEWDEIKDMVDQGDVVLIVSDLEDILDSSGNPVDVVMVNRDYL